MSNNHLIIALGGTGGKIIRALRKSIYEEFHSKEPLLRTRDDQGAVEEKPHPVKIGYLYVDSSETLMRGDDPTWRIPGNTLQVGQSSQLRIRGANLASVLDNLSAYPNISEWIGPREKWSDILSSSEAEAAGGQKRRLGRFLFACKTRGADGFVAKLRNQVAELRKQTNEAAVVFHVCVGLAGGTGSGSVIDVVAQIRNLFSEDYNRIILYALLPESDPPADWDRGNYHANGYAALLELNALNVGAYQPWDVAEGKGRIEFRDSSGAPVSPVNGCYVFTNENEHGKILNVDRDEVSQVVASFLFQKIIMVNTTEWADTLSRLENAENNPEPPLENAPGTNIAQRSKRFLTFGIKRLVIPEEEIREFLTFQFARQAVLQLQYNHWSKTQQGYLDSPVDEAFAQYVTDSRNHEAWAMSDGHLCLETGILPMELQDQWKPIEAEWNTVITNSAQISIKGEAKTWMATLTRLAEDFFDLRWRGKGVVAFYKNKLADQAAEASAIVRKIEHELFENWITGKRSMLDIGRIVGELQRVLREKREICERKVAEFRPMIEESKGANALLADIRKNNQTWADIGPLSAAFGKRDRTIQAQAEVFKRFYGARHRIEAWAYAGLLVEKLLLELETLAGTVATNISRLTELVEGETNHLVKERFVGLKERIEARCNENESVDFNDHVVKFYDPRQVRDFATRIIGNEEIQSRQAGAVRKAMLEKLGEAPTLAKFHQRLNKGVLLDLVETICGEEAEKAHNNIIAEDPRTDRILGNNIIDKLYRDYNGNPLALRHYISDLVTRAGLYLKFDAMEMQNTNPGASQSTFIQNFTVIFPKAQEHPQFNAEVEAAFKDAFGKKVDFVEGGNSNEITMISLANLFPLRYAKPVRFLESKYKSRISALDRARFELHSEGDGRSYPSLFLVSGGDVDILPLLLLGRAMKIIQESEDPKTGKTDICLLTKDARGRDNDPVPLGESEDAIIARRDVALENSLRMSIRAILEKDYQHVTKREEIRTEFDRILDRLAVRVPNPRDERRKAYNVAVNTAEEMLG
jgi:Tubulin like